MAEDIFIESDGSGFTVFYHTGKRKMHWDIDSGGWAKEAFGETLRDILEALGETPIARYQSEIRQAMAAGEAVMDPRTNPPGEQDEGGKLGPDLQKYVDAATAGTAWLRGRVSADRLASDTIDWDSSGSATPPAERKQALARALTEGASKGLTNRWAPKPTDRYVDGPG